MFYGIHVVGNLPNIVRQCEQLSSPPGSAGHLRWPLYQWPPNCQKMKCSFLDYIQLLIISRAFQATKVAQNAKKKQKNGCQIIKNEMLIF